MIFSTRFRVLSIENEVLISDCGKGPLSMRRLPEWSVLFFYSSTSKQKVWILKYSEYSTSSSINTISKPFGKQNFWDISISTGIRYTIWWLPSIYGQVYSFKLNVWMIILVNIILPGISAVWLSHSQSTLADTSVSALGLGILCDGFLAFITRFIFLDQMLQLRKVQTLRSWP